MRSNNIQTRLWLRAALTVLAVALWLPVLADGEQREGEQGTKWVDPVEFFKLKDINRTDFQRDYDQGDIDFNKVLAERGLKVYGLKLKALCAAGLAEKYAWVTHLGGQNSNFHFDYHDMQGVRGMPLHEASFCIYPEGGVDLAYTFDYGCSAASRKNGYRATETAHNELDILGLRLAPTNEGVGFFYALSGEATHQHHYEYVDADPPVSGDKTYPYKSFKPGGVDNRMGHFIYFRGASNLLVMLAAPAKDDGNDYSEATKEAMTHPWARVYFVVEEILVQEEEEPASMLSEEERQEMVNYMEDLTTWLKGEGDPLGLDEHSGPLEAAVINTLGIVASILLGNGIASVVGGSGASITSGLTSALLSGAGGEAPPPPSDFPPMDGQLPKRPEDDTPPDVPDDEGGTPPPPPDPGKFTPTNYPDYCNQFIKQQPDGDVVMKSPATGQDVHYYSNGDGTWFSDSGMTYTSADIEERLRFEAENAGYVKQNADDAARAVAEQRAQWDAQNQRDLERGYSDEMKEFRDWKAQQEAAQKRQDFIDKMALKYHTANNEEAIKKAMKFEQVMREIDQRTAMEEVKAWDKSIEYLGKVDKTCEVAVNLMGSCVPGGAAVKNAYTFAKSTLVAASESIAEGKSAEDGLRHVLVGMADGALGVIQNEAGSIVDGQKCALLKEMGITLATEGAKDMMNKYYETGDWGKTFDAGLSAVATKNTEFWAGKAISGVFGFVKTSAAQSLDPKSVTFETDTGLRFSEGTAKVIDKVMNKPWNWTKNTNIGIKGVNIDVDDAVGKFSFSGTSNVTFGGTVKGGDLVEGVFNEVLGTADPYDWSGDVAVGLKNDVVDFVGEVKKFSDNAAKYRRR